MSIRKMTNYEIAIHQLQMERYRIARILAEFAAAPVSMASIQPILELAAELNEEQK